jgi:hypothetical protein
VHFIVLDNVVWNGAKAAKRGYTSSLGAKQLEFVRNDLKFVPRDKLVVLAMHIPITSSSDREALYRILENRPHTLSLSAHTHIQKHLFLDKEDGWNGAQPHHHLNHATVCGSWWSGEPDALGIPHATMADGAPNGYSFIDFNGHNYEVTFKAARYPANYQMNIYVPDEIAAADVAKQEVVVNVFAGSEKSTVEMRVGNGNWTKLPHTPRQDPQYLAVKAQEPAGKDTLKVLRGRKLPATHISSHIWSSTLPADLKAGAHLLEIRTTDMFGRSYSDRRVLRVI